MPSTPWLDDQKAFRLESFLSANVAIDWRTIPLVDGSALSTVLRTQEEAELLPLLRAYQRLLYVLPPGDEARALPLLRRGLHSAIQIASVPLAQFIEIWNSLFADQESLGERVHENAIARRAQVLLHHVHSVQNDEPHYRAARFR